MYACYAEHDTRNCRNIGLTIELEQTLATEIPTNGAKETLPYEDPKDGTDATNSSKEENPHVGSNSGTIRGMFSLLKRVE